jgi:hypothetical protein
MCIWYTFVLSAMIGCLVVSLFVAVRVVKEVRRQIEVLQKQLAAETGRRRFCDCNGQHGSHSVHIVNPR